MYEARYRKYITKSHARFAEPAEITEHLQCMHGEQQYAAGAPMYFRDGKLFVDAEDNHTIGIGPSGCKKSRVAVFATVMSVILAGESAVINDPKGEIYRKTAAAAQRKGARVQVLNFRRPSLSHHWNPLTQAYKYFKAHREDEALQCITEFANSVVSPALEHTNDRYWQDSARVFMISLILLLLATGDPELINIQNLIPFCYESSYPALKAVLQGMDDSHPVASGLHTVVDLTAEKTRSCIYGSLLAMMNPFIQNKSLQTMLSGNSFDVESLATKQTIVYVIYPDEKESMNFLVNMFLTQCYEILVNYAAGTATDRLPLRVNFVLDEFSNLTPITNFANRISESRSKNIRYFLFVQSYGQLKEKYDSEADSILANCSNWLCWSSKEVSFLHTVSEMCGKEVDYNGIEHPLIDAFEMQHLRKEWEGAEVLILRQGMYPYVAFLPDFDFVAEFKNFRPVSLPYFHETHPCKAITVDDWVKMIDAGTIPYPYPKRT